MVKTKPNKQFGSGMVSLDNIGSALTTQSTIREQRQQTEMDTTIRTQKLTSKAHREALAINDQARADAQQIRDQQLEILDGVYSQVEKAKTAMALADSDNPLDRLNLWFLQQQDKGYTREGNTARLGYLLDASTALGAIDTVNQAGYADQIAATEELLNVQLAEADDRLAIIKLQEAQGQELIDAEIQAQNARLGIMQTQNSMQQNAIVNMTDEQVELARRQAAASPNRTINVGGVEVSQAQLDERASAIASRRYNEQVMQTNMADMAISNMTMEQLQELHKEAIGAKNRRVDIGGVSVPAGRIEDRMYDLNNRDAQQLSTQYQIANMQESLVQKAQQNVLDSMLLPELEFIIQNGFKDQNGVKYDANMVRTARDLKADDDMKRLSGQATVAAMASAVNPAVSARDEIDSIMPNLPIDSPAKAALNQARQGLGWAASRLNTNDPIQVQIGQQLVTAAQENVQNILNAEAARLAAGDKELETAYQYTLRGQQIPPDLIESTIVERVKAGKPIGRWLTGPQNAIFVTTYRDAKFRIEQESVGGMSQIPKEDIEAMAAEEAYQAVVNAAAAPVSDVLMQMPAAIPGSPLYGAISTPEWGALLRNSEQAAIQQYIEQNQVDAATAAQIRIGALIPGELQTMQNAKLYAELERKKPGLGDAYIQWFAGEGREQMVNRYTEAALADARGDFTKTSELSLVMPHLNPSLAQYANDLVQGKQANFVQELQQQHAEFIGFGNNPQTKQLYLIEATPGLNTQEKQIAMQQIIQPLVDQATANGYTDIASSTLFVESALRDFEPATPQARTILRKLISGRDAATGALTAFVQANTGFNRVFGGLDPKLNVTQGLTSADFGPAANPSQYQWYRDLLANGVQTSGPAMNRGML